MAGDMMETMESNAEESIHNLRQLVNDNDATKVFQLDDAFLLKFLRAKNFSVSDAFNLILGYVNMFKKYPQYFNGVETLKKAYELDFFNVLPDRGRNGELVAIMRCGVYDPDVIDFFDLVAVTVYGFDLAELDEEIQKNGAIEILDVADISWKAYFSIGLSQIRFMVDMTENSLPIKWRKLFVVNQNTITTILYNMAKPFLSKDIKEKIHFIGTNVSKIHELVDPSVLPGWYGGTKKTHAMDSLEHIKQNEGKLMNLWRQFKLKA